MVAALKASLLPSGIAVGVPGNITGGGIAQRLPCQHIAVKQHFGQHMLLLPVHLIFHLNGAVSAEQPQVLGPGGFICLQHGLKCDALTVLLDQSQRLRHGQGHLLFSVIRQNVPGVIVAGFILIKSQFIKGAVCPLTLHFFVIQACNGAVLIQTNGIERRLHPIAVHLQPIAAIDGLAQGAAAQGCQIGQQPVASLAHTGGGTPFVFHKRQGIISKVQRVKIAFAGADHGVQRRLNLSIIRYGVLKHRVNMRAGQNIMKLVDQQLLIKCRNLRCAIFATQHSEHFRQAKLIFQPPIGAL